MISAFLVCALAVAPTASFHPAEDTHAGRLANAISLSFPFIKYTAKDRKPVLYAGGNPASVGAARMAGIKAFGVFLRDWPERYKSSIFTLAHPGHLPFTENTFSAVHWLHSNPLNAPNKKVFQDVAETVIPGGYFLFDEEAYLLWVSLLKNNGWYRLPFRSGVLNIWQKPYGGNVHLLKRSS